MIHRLGLSFIVWRQKAQRGAGLTLCTGWRSKICLDMCSTFPALIFACCSVIVVHNLSLECAQNFVRICTLCPVHKTPKHKLLYRMCRVVDSTIFPCEAHFTLYKSNGSPLVGFARGRTAYDYNNFGHCAWIWLSTTCTDNAELKHHSHFSVFSSSVFTLNHGQLMTTDYISWWGQHKQLNLV